MESKTLLAMSVEAVAVPHAGRVGWLSGRLDAFAGRRQPLVPPLEGQGRQANLLDVVRALRGGRRSANLHDRRNQDRDQDRNDRDHDQQFDQGKTLREPIWKIFMTLKLLG